MLQTGKSSGLHPAVAERLARLAPDQRAAATAPPGPILCVAPAGSGKTTTLVARVAWLVATGVEPATICAVTFNRRAAEELEQRLTSALAPLEAAGAVGVRVRTFHALGREILLDAGRSVDPLVDRSELLGELFGPDLPPGDRQRLDNGFSRLKLDLAVPTDELAAQAAAARLRGDPPGPVVGAFLRYEAVLQERGAVDFDDLVRLALEALRQESALRDRWRSRCAHLLVDELQDVDRSQLDLALLLAAPANRIFAVGDDDQTIYAWRLADVRRVLGLAAALPGLRRVDLTTNYRCPAPVVERAVRLVAHNLERFDKRIAARPGAEGDLFLAPDPGDDVARARRLLSTWPAGRGEVRAVLARTNAELAPYAAAALELGLAYRATDDGLPLDDAALDAALGLLERDDARAHPATPWNKAGPDACALPAHIARVERHVVDPALRHALRGLRSWAAGAASAPHLRARLGTMRERRRQLRRDDADLVLATVHGTKGLEYDHVAVVNLDEDRFPSARTLEDAEDPRRGLEEERRLAYVAWTRARRTLVLVYDPGAPSPFLLEAFDPAELGVPSSRSHAQQGRDRAAAARAR